MTSASSIAAHTRYGSHWEFGNACIVVSRRLQPALGLKRADAGSLRALLMVLQVVENKRANETYILYQCGTPNPMNSADTEVVVPANTKVFEIPLVSVAVADSAAAGLLVSQSLC